MFFYAARVHITAVKIGIGKHIIFMYSGCT